MAAASGYEKADPLAAKVSHRKLRSGQVGSGKHIGLRVDVSGEFGVGIL